MCFKVVLTALSSERINGQRAKTSRKNMRKRVPSLQNSKNPHAKWAAKPPNFGALFRVLERWNSLAHICSRGFCKKLTNYFRQHACARALHGPCAPWLAQGRRARRVFTLAHGFLLRFSQAGETTIANPLRLWASKRVDSSLSTDQCETDSLSPGKIRLLRY